MNPPALTTRRAFLTNLSTAAAVTVAAPIVSALPLPGSQPKRASIPLRWKEHELLGGVWYALAGPCVVGGFNSDIDLDGKRTYFWRFGGYISGEMMNGVIDTTDKARAAIQAEWDKLCGAEPSEPVAPVLPKVKMLEWIGNDYGVWWAAGTPFLMSISECKAPRHGYFVSATGIRAIDDGGNWILHPTLEAAKAAAQNHWEKTVLGALEQQGVS